VSGTSHPVARGWPGYTWAGSAWTGGPSASPTILLAGGIISKSREPNIGDLIWL
jgi:hypothetical protein